MKIGNIHIPFTSNTSSVGEEKDISLSKLTKQFGKISQIKQHNPFKGFHGKLSSGINSAKSLLKREASDSTSARKADFKDTIQILDSDTATRKQKTDALGDLFNL